MMAGNAEDYLAHIDLDPCVIINCASLHCRKRFAVGKGFAAEVVIGQEGIVFFFCSQACYLRDVPTECCPRA